MNFLECPPDLEDHDTYVDEADLFYISPLAWLNAEFYNSMRLPTHLVMFSVLEQVSTLNTRTVCSLFSHLLIIRALGLVELRFPGYGCVSMVPVYGHA